MQSFENAHQLKSVSRPGDQLEGGNRLEVGIRNFQISLEPKPTALVEFSVRLLGDKGNVVGTRIFKTIGVGRKHGSATSGRRPQPSLL